MPPTLPASPSSTSRSSPPASIASSAAATVAASCHSTGGQVGRDPLADRAQHRGPGAGVVAVQQDPHRGRGSSFSPVQLCSSVVTIASLDRRSVLAVDGAPTEGHRHPSTTAVEPTTRSATPRSPNPGLRTHDEPISDIMAFVSTAAAAATVRPELTVHRPNPVSVGTIVWLVERADVLRGPVRDVLHDPLGGTGDLAGRVRQAQRRLRLDQHPRPRAELGHVPDGRGRSGALPALPQRQAVAGRPLGHESSG